MPLWTNHSNEFFEVFTVGGWRIVGPHNTIMAASSPPEIAPLGTHTGISTVSSSQSTYSSLAESTWMEDEWQPPPPLAPTPPPNGPWGQPTYLLSPGSVNFSSSSNLMNMIFTGTASSISETGKYITPMPIENEELFYNRKLAQVIAFKHGLHKGDIGLEIECEGTSLFNTPFSYWTCHADGSLRDTGGHPPVEYVLKQPLPVSEVKDALGYLNQKFKEAGSKIVKSNRTSVHVHMNCQQMTIRQLYCFLCLYLIFEEILVDWSGPERAGNLFCLRAKDSNFYITMLESVLKNGNFKQWREDYRYSACNVASVTKFGSLEFRSMQGTVNVQDIQTWVEILMMLKETSLKYDNPIEIVEDFTAVGPLPFFKKIFQHKEFSDLFDTNGLSGKLWDGLRLMRDVAYASDWKAPQIKKNKPRVRKPKQ